MIYHLYIVLWTPPKVKSSSITVYLSPSPPEPSSTCPHSPFPLVITILPQHPHVACIHPPVPSQGLESYNRLLLVLPHPFLSLLDHHGQYMHMPKHHLLWKNTFHDHLSPPIYPHIQHQFLWFSPPVPEKAIMWPAHHMSSHLSCFCGTLRSP